MVPLNMWYTQTTPPQLREVLSQVGWFLQAAGYDETVKALAIEAGGRDVHINIEKYIEENEKAGGRSDRLMDMWKLAENNVGGRPRMDSTDGEEGSESSDDESSSEADEVEGGAPVEEKLAKLSSDSEDDSSSDSDSSAKAGQKRKRELTPESSDDSSSDSSSDVDAMKDDAAAASSESDSDSDSSSDESDKRPAKRTKVSDGEKGIVKEDSSSSDSDSGSSSSGKSSELATILPAIVQ